MSLYEDRFSTDWDTLDQKEAVNRAFALGVAASLGDRNAEEFEGVLAEMDSNYAESMVELAYEEGKQKATKRERQAGPDEDDSDIFELVVSEELEGAEPPDSDDDAGRATDLPSAVSDPPEATDKPDPDPEQTDFPDFLE